MTSAGVLFYLSFAALSGMLISKLIVVQRGIRDPFSFLSRFDAPLGRVLVRVVTFGRSALSMAWHALVDFSHASRVLVTDSLHHLLKAAESRVRGWREFARERKIERKTASRYIQDVFEHKNNLKGERKTD